MKTYSYILVLILLTFSCNNDDDVQQNTDPTLNGPWSLVNVSGGLIGVNDDFELGLITWNFNIETSEVTISNSNAEPVIFDGLASGIYNYEVLSTTGEVSYVVINSFNYAITTLSSSQLILDEGVAADGFLLKFSR